MAPTQTPVRRKLSLLSIVDNVWVSSFTAETQACMGGRDTVFYLPQFIDHFTHSYCIVILC